MQWRNGRPCFVLSVWLALCSVPAWALDVERSPVSRVTLLVKHVHYGNFAERHRVAIDEEFRISDGEISAKVVAFYPDFVIDKDGDAGTRSQDMKNPAVKVEVMRDGKKVDTVYAFPVKHHSGISKEARIYFILLEYGSTDDGNKTVREEGDEEG